MRIRDSYYGSNRPEQIRSGSVNGAGKVDDNAARIKVEATAQVAKDRVEISDAARAAADDPKSRDLVFARKALLGMPPLSPERAEDILKRVQEGFYSQPEVIKEVAHRFSTDAAGDGAPQE